MNIRINSPQISQATALKSGKKLTINPIEVITNFIINNKDISGNNVVIIFDNYNAYTWNEIIVLGAQALRKAFPEMNILCTWHEQRPNKFTRIFCKENNIVYTRDSSIINPDITFDIDYENNFIYNKHNEPIGKIVNDSIFIDKTKADYFNFKL